MTETRTYHQLTPDTFTTVLAIGSRIETWDGVWGTVTAIEDVDTHGHVLAKMVTFHAEHTTTYDGYGWPKDGGPMDITREVRKYSSDLRWISDGTAAMATRITDVVNNVGGGWRWITFADGREDSVTLREINVRVHKGEWTITDQARAQVRELDLRRV